MKKAAPVRVRLDSKRDKGPIRDSLLALRLLPSSARMRRDIVGSEADVRPTIGPFTSASLYPSASHLCPALTRAEAHTRRFFPLSHLRVHRQKTETQSYRLRLVLRRPFCLQYLRNSCLLLRMGFAGKWRFYFYPICKVGKTTTAFHAIIISVVVIVELEVLPEPKHCQPVHASPLPWVIFGH